MTYREIAVELGCTSENIRKIERRAIRKLRENPDIMQQLEGFLGNQGRRTLWELIEDMAWEKQ